MTVKWLALSILTALIALAAVAPASAHTAAGVSAASSAADTDFSAKGQYVKKQDGGWNRTKKYR